MQSSNLLPALRELPGGDETGQTRSFRDNITGIVSMDRAMYAAEFASGVSFGLWFVFDERSLLGIDIPDGMPTSWPGFSEVTAPKSGGIGQTLKCLQLITGI